MHLIVAFIFLGLISDLFSFHMIVRVCFYISVLLQFLKKKKIMMQGWLGGCVMSGVRIGFLLRNLEQAKIK